MAGKITCLICGQQKGARDFIKHRNELLSDQVSICKDCANEQADFTDEQSIIAMCQLANLPYVYSLVAEVARENTEPNFGIYMRKLAPFKKYQDFADSVYNDADNNGPVSKIEITDEIVRRWGSDYTNEQYAFFERALRALLDIKPATTTLEIERYVQNIRLKDSLDEAFKTGDYKAITQLRKAYEDDLKSLGLDEVLSSKDNSSKTVGQKIKEIELKRPIPAREEYKDPTGIREYIQKWFIIPMKRNFGLADEKEEASLYEQERKQD